MLNSERWRRTFLFSCRIGDNGSAAHRLNLSRSRWHPVSSTKPVTIKKKFELLHILAELSLETTTSPPVEPREYNIGERLAANVVRQP